MTDETQTTTPNFNLLAALRGSLRVIDNPAPGTDPDSPLSEATADSVNYLLGEINDALAEGMPERITDERLIQVVDIFRAQALRWLTEEAEKKNKPRGTRTKAPKGNIIEITL